MFYAQVLLTLKESSTDYDIDMVHATYQTITALLKSEIYQ
jgi:hypothetical protein